MNKYEKQNCLFNYYCIPFLYSYFNKKDHYFVNKHNSFNETNNYNLNRICPFKLCKDK